MRYSESLGNIASALAKVQAEIKNPLKNQQNKGVQGAPLYANLEDTLQDYVRPVCSKHGISVVQSIKTDEAGRVGVCTALFHESGEYIEGDYVFCDIVIPVSNNGKKILTEGQATGVCITYLRRYSLNAMLGINGDKDTDGSYSDTPEEETPTPLTYEQSLNFVLTFGQHKGKTLQEVWKADLQYIEWLWSNEKTDAVIKQAINTISAELNRKRAEKEKANAQ